MSKPHRPTVQAPGVHHFAVGDMLVTALNDGMFEASFDLLAGLDTAAADRRHRDTFRAIPPKLAVNCFLLWTADRLVLVDSGCGTAFGPQLGRTAGWLRAIGVTPADIDTVLLTHMHTDHVGGLVDPAGAAVFPHAELVMHETEAAFWSDDATLAGAVDEGKRASVQRARATLAAYEGRTRRLARGEALPGVSILPEPGHTPGHSGWLVSSGLASLLIWGDIVHMPGLQFAHPEAAVTYDVDIAQAVPTRQRMLDMVATDRLAVAGMHLDFPTFGHVVRKAEGYAFVPEVWRPEI